MADRTSAEVFGFIFEKLSDNPTDENKKLADEIFAKTMQYDFSHYQMYADEALQKLGLAKMGVDPEYPDDGEVMIYKGDSGWE